MPLYQQLLEATQLKIGRRVEHNWIDLPAEFTYGPGLGTSGVNLGVSTANSVQARLTVSNRQVLGQKSLFVTINAANFDSAKTYQVTVNGTPYNGTGQVSVEATLQQIADLINTAFPAAYDPKAVLVASTNSGVIDTVLVYELDDPAGSAAAMTVDILVTGTGSSVADMVGYVDAGSARARVWSKPNSTTSLPIEIGFTLKDMAVIDLTTSGINKDIDVASDERLYVELFSLSKDAGDGAFVTVRPLLVISPTILEGT